MEFQMRIILEPKMDKKILQEEIKTLLIQQHQQLILVMPGILVHGKVM
jgi:hypothetical protein